MTFDRRATERDPRARSASLPAVAPGKRTLVQDIATDTRAPAADDGAAALPSSAVERDTGRPRVALASLFGTRAADDKRDTAMPAHNALDGRVTGPVHNEQAAPGGPAVSTNSKASAPSTSPTSQQGRSISASPANAPGEHRAPVAATAAPDHSAANAPARPPSGPANGTGTPPPLAARPHHKHPHKPPLIVPHSPTHPIVPHPVPLHPAQPHAGQGGALAATAVATRTPQMLVAPTLAAPDHTSNATRGALEQVRAAATAGHAAVVERVATTNQTVVAAVHHEQQRLTQTGAAQRAAISQRFALARVRSTQLWPLRTHASMAASQPSARR
jgi:hypothetical protein